MEDNRTTIIDKLPEPKNNGKVFANALEKMVTQCKPTSAELDRVCVTRMGLALREVLTAYWDSTAPWNTANDSPHQTQLTALHQALETQFKTDINIATVNACVQNTEDFVALLVDLTKMQRKVFWKTGVPHVVVANSLALSDHDVGMALQDMGVSCCDTDLATGQKVNNGDGATIHPFHCTLSAHSPFM